MTSEQIPILKILHIPPIIDDILRTLSFDNKISQENLRIQYLSLSMGNKDIEIKKIPQISRGKSVLIPSEIDNMFRKQARETNIGYNDIFLAHLIYGIKTANQDDVNIHKALDEFFDDLKNKRLFSNLDL